MLMALVMVVNSLAGLYGSYRFGRDIVGPWLTKKGWLP